MATSKAYFDFITGQLSLLGDDVAYRAMMGEYLIYYRGRVAGGIYDDRLLVKPVASACAYLPEAALEPPYAGAKAMLLVDEVDDREYLAALFKGMYDDLPAPKTKKKR